VMKMSKKGAIVIALALCIAFASVAVFAAFAVTSNPVSVSTTYTVSLTQTRYYSTYTLIATVTDGSSSGASNVYYIPVYFQVSVGNGAWNTFATVYTDSNGVASTTYSATTNGEWDQFQAVAGIP
jgi:flagellar basal body-associated protein FliL